MGILTIIYSILAYGLPSLASMRAVVTKDDESIREMTTYWVIYILLEVVSLLIHFHIIFKMCIIIWLTAPMFQGSYYLYNRLLKHNYDKYEEDIDSMLADIQRQSIRRVKQTFWDILLAQSLAASAHDGSVALMRDSFKDEFRDVLLHGAFFELQMPRANPRCVKCILNNICTLLQLRASETTSHEPPMVLSLLCLLSVSVDINDGRNIVCIVNVPTLDGNTSEIIILRPDSASEADTLCAGLQLQCMSLRARAIHAINTLNQKRSSINKLMSVRLAFHVLRYGAGAS